MKVINLFAGPSCGKSTIAAGVFYQLKKRGFKVEYVKDVTYENSMDRHIDPLYVLAQHHHRLLKLKDKVQFAICDGSFLLGDIYFKDNGIYDEKLFKKFVLGMFNSYDNLNYFIKRKDKNYHAYGRSESLKEALSLDRKILRLLNKKDIPFKKNTPKKSIYSIIDDIC